jgi:ubiquinone/menaquinone biosynthesis C-methylase UbiE
VPLKRGDWVLDLGCGEGRHAIAAWLAAEVNCVGVDLCAADLAAAACKSRAFSEQLPAGAARSLSLSVGDALNLPFADQCFDVVICSEVLEHVVAYRDVLPRDVVSQARGADRQRAALLAGVDLLGPQR